MLACKLLFQQQHTCGGAQAGPQRYSLTCLSLQLPSRDPLERIPSRFSSCAESKLIRCCADVLLPLVALLVHLGWW